MIGLSASWHGPHLVELVEHEDATTIEVASTGRPWPAGLTPALG
jgi:hypothetical protein